MLGHLRNKQCRKPSGKAVNVNARMRREKEDEGGSEEEASGSESREESTEFYCPFKCGNQYKSRASLRSHIVHRCLKNPESEAKIKANAVRARTKAKLAREKRMAKREMKEEATETAMDQDDEEHASMDHAHEQEHAAKDHEEDEPERIVGNEESEEQQQFENPDESTCYEIAEIYEVQELPEGVHIEGATIHDEAELIRTINFDEAYQLPEAP